MLAVALTLHEQSIAPCGHYMDAAFGEHGAGVWEAVAVVCAACAAIEQWEEAHKDDREPGVKVHAVNEAAALDDDREVKPVFGPRPDPEPAPPPAEPAS